MSRLLCKFFGHRRNIQGVRRSGEGWRSTCIRCRQPLIRISRGAWQLHGDSGGPVPEEFGELPLFDRQRR